MVPRLPETGEVVQTPGIQPREDGGWWVRAQGHCWLCKGKTRQGYVLGGSVSLPAPPLAHGRGSRQKAEDSSGHKRLLHKQESLDLVPGPMVFILFGLVCLKELGIYRKEGLAVNPCTDRVGP